MLRTFAFVAYFIVMVLSMFPRCGVAAPTLSITLAHSVVPLNGPWKFHMGDNAEWAHPTFVDDSWEAVDLTPLPGAHDSDVGLTDYVAGWQARGHAGYIGYAWYRLTLAIDAPPGESLALSGPPDVDSAYQVFFDGHLLGGIGDFSGTTPVAYSIQPRIFQLPSAIADHQPHVLAIRVFMGPWDAGPADAGGIHIAPAIGGQSGIEARFVSQWVETVKGYIVEVVEAFLFALLAVMSLSLSPFDRGNRSYGWLAAALIIVALYRANQAVFFWGQFESVHAFEWVSYVLLTPLCLGVWTYAWLSWFHVRRPSWLPALILVLTGLYMLAQCMSGSWFYGVFPQRVASAVDWAITVIRLLMGLILGFVTVQGVRKRMPDYGCALLAVILISIGLFASELSALDIPGIWFPFGTGVSRTQYAYLAFDMVLGVLLLRRLWRYAAVRRSSHSGQVMH